MDKIELLISNIKTLTAVVENLSMKIDNMNKKIEEIEKNKPSCMSDSPHKFEIPSLPEGMDAKLREMFDLPSQETMKKMKETVIIIKKIMKNPFFNRFQPDDNSKSKYNDCIVDVDRINSYMEEAILSEEPDNEELISSLLKIQEAGFISREIKPDEEQMKIKEELQKLLRECP